MYCFANNLPRSDDHQRAESAVIAGIGASDASVENYSIVADQCNDIWQVQIRIRGRQEPLFVDLDSSHQASEQIETIVADALAMSRLALKANGGVNVV